VLGRQSAAGRIRMRFVAALLLALFSGVLCAAEQHPYFEAGSWRTPFGQKDPAPQLYEVMSLSDLQQVPKDARAIDYHGVLGEEVWGELSSRQALDELHLTADYSAGIAEKLAALPRLKTISLYIRGAKSKEQLAPLANLHPSGLLYVTFTESWGDGSTAGNLPVIDAPLRLMVSHEPGLGNASLAPLVLQPRLELLHFSNATLNAGAAAPIAECKALKFLFLKACTGFDTTFCESLALSPSLEAIGGDSQTFNAVGLAALAKIKTLRHMMIDGKVGVTAAEFAAMLKKMNLESLTVNDFDAVNDDVVKEIAGFKRMRHLQLVLPKEVTDESVKKLGALKSLVWFYLSSKLRRDVSVFDILGGMKKLQYLSWSVTAAPPAAALKKLPGDLVFLALWAKDLKADHLKVIAGFGHLEELKISSTEDFAARDLMVLTGAKALKRLLATWPDGAKEEFTKKRPDVELLE
jgi:hypothetical protein